MSAESKESSPLSRRGFLFLGGMAVGGMACGPITRLVEALQTPTPIEPTETAKPSTPSPTLTEVQKTPAEPEAISTPSPSSIEINRQKLVEAERGEIVELDNVSARIWRTDFPGGDAYWGKIRKLGYIGEPRLRKADCAYNAYQEHGELGIPIGDAEWEPDKPLRSVTAVVAKSHTQIGPIVLDLIEITYDDGSEEGEIWTCEVETLSDDLREAWEKLKSLRVTSTPSP